MKAGFRNITWMQNISAGPVNAPGFKLSAHCYGRRSPDQQACNIRRHAPVLLRDVRADHRRVVILQLRQQRGLVAVVQGLVQLHQSCLLRPDGHHSLRRTQGFSPGSYSCAPGYNSAAPGLYQGSFKHDGPRVRWVHCMYRSGGTPYWCIILNAHSRSSGVRSNYASVSSLLPSGVEKHHAGLRRSLRAAARVKFSWQPSVMLRCRDAGVGSDWDERTCLHDRQGASGGRVLCCLLQRLICTCKEAHHLGMTVDGAKRKRLKTPAFTALSREDRGNVTWEVLCLYLFEICSAHAACTRIDASCLSADDSIWRWAKTGSNS